MTRARILADYVSSGDELALKAPITNAALVTPNLGTPSAGVMTNVTGMPASALSASGISSAKFLKGDNTWDTAGGANTPSFHIKSHDNSAQIPADTWTLVDFATTVYDTGSYWVAATNKFLPTDGVTKKYFIYTQVRIQYDDVSIWEISIYKNGSAISYSKGHIVNLTYTYPTLYSATMIELDGVDDYVQVYVKIPTARYLKVDPLGMYFGGYALIN